jgi:hypothetical protein
MTSIVLTVLQPAVFHNPSAQTLKGLQDERRLDKVNHSLTRGEAPPMTEGLLDKLILTRTRYAAAEDTMKT